ncbi:hypothetical protein K439DRAFT_1357406, partial [Ramaria rubella]
LQYMLKILEHKPDMYLDEITLELMDKLGLSISFSTVHCSLKLLGITIKKVYFVCLNVCGYTYIYNSSPRLLLSIVRHVGCLPF